MCILLGNAKRKRTIKRDIAEANKTCDKSMHYLFKALYYIKKKIFYFLTIYFLYILFIKIKANMTKKFNTMKKS